MTYRTILAAAMTAAVLLPAAPAAAATRACPQSDAANGLRSVRVEGISCASGFAVAKRTNSIKCFLNSNTCSHTFRGRRWRCRSTDTATGARVRCTSGRRVVTYRLG